MHIAKLSVIDDGQTHNDGPAPTRCGSNGRKNHARHINVQAGKTANGRIRVFKSHNHVDTKYVRNNNNYFKLEHFGLLDLFAIPIIIHICTIKKI